MIHLKLMPILSLNTISTTPPEPADMLNFSEMKCKKLAKTSVRDILRYPYHKRLYYIIIYLFENEHISNNMINIAIITIFNLTEKI